MVAVGSEFEPVKCGTEITTANSKSYLALQCAKWKMEENVASTNYVFVAMQPSKRMLPRLVAQKPA
jgi:hypothetical protein